MSPAELGSTSANSPLSTERSPELAQLALLSKVGLGLGQSDSNDGAEFMYLQTEKAASPTGFESGGSGRQRPALGRIGPMGATRDTVDVDLTDADATPAGRNEPKPELELEGVAEPALARALVLAAEAGRWAIVEQIARELKERRKTLASTPSPVLRLHRGTT